MATQNTTPSAETRRRPDLAKINSAPLAPVWAALEVKSRSGRYRKLKALGPDFYFEIGHTMYGRISALERLVFGVPTETESGDSAPPAS